MPAQQQEEKGRAERENQAHQRRRLVISEQVVQLLGEPGNLHAIQVRKLWDDHYRVNVFVGADAASATIAHSYFLLTDAEGNIIAATPKIARQY